MRTKDTAIASTPFLIREFEIDFVLLSKGWHTNGNTRKVDAFVLAQDAAVDHFAFHILAFDSEHQQLDQSIGEQNACPGLKIFGQRGEGGGDDRRGAGNVAGSDGEALAGFKLYGLAVLQAARPNFGSLQVAQDADALALLARYFADHFDEFQLLRMSAMGEVQARDIESGTDQLAKGLFHCSKPAREWRRSWRGADFSPAQASNR